MKPFDKFVECCRAKLRTFIFCLFMESGILKLDLSLSSAADLSSVGRAEDCSRNNILIDILRSLVRIRQVGSCLFVIVFFSKSVQALPGFSYGYCFPFKSFGGLSNRIGIIIQKERRRTIQILEVISSFLNHKNDPSITSTTI